MRTLAAVAAASCTIAAAASGPMHVVELNGSAVSLANIALVLFLTALAGTCITLSRGYSKTLQHPLMPGICRLLKLHTRLKRCASALLMHQRILGMSGDQ